MKWNCNNIVDFLKIYEQYPLLWNIKHKDYLNIKLKDEIFKKLYADLENERLIMGVDEKQLEAKIKNLKDVYRNELAKIKKVEKVEVEQMKYILQNLRGSTLPTFFVKFYQQDTASQIWIENEGSTRGSINDIQIDETIIGRPRPSPTKMKPPSGSVKKIKKQTAPDIAIVIESQLNN
ncbi:hypothetical protein QTP88_014700 [Uroleucon formosanum]